MSFDTSSDAKLSWLDVVNKIDNVPHDFSPSQHGFHKFCIGDDSNQVGWIPEDLVLTMPWTAGFIVDSEHKTVYMKASSDTDAASDRTQAMQDLLEKAVTCDAVKHFTKFHRKREVNIITGIKDTIGVDRNASELFGMVAAGAHMTCYTWVKWGDGSKEMKLWVPRRAYNKSNHPGMLDNTVAGGICNGLSPLQCIIAEAEEEAGIDPEYVKRNVKHAGTVTFLNILPREEGGFLLPRVRYNFVLELPEGMIPEPNDGEVHDFRAWSVEELMEAVSRGEMKEDTALVWLDFLIRHGFVNSENEPDLCELVSRIHRRLSFSTQLPA